MQRRQFLALAIAGLASTACGARVGDGTAATSTPGPIPPRPAAAQPTATTRATTVVHPVAGSADRVLLRDEAENRLIGIDAGTGHVAYTIDATLPTPDWSHWLGFTDAGDSTSVTLYGARDGRPERSFNVAGQFTDGAVSFDDSWLLLVQPPAAGASNLMSRLALVKLIGGTVTRQHQLSGRYLADAAGNAGYSAYLIEEHPEKGADAYAVVLYDPVKSAVTAKVADKLSAQTLMSGRRVSRAWSPLGDWLYSLYLDPGGNGAFIHALNVGGQFTFCIDLPGAKEPASVLQQYTLAVSKTSRNVYAVNPALGQISIVDYGAPTAITYSLTLPALPGAVASPSAGVRSATGYRPTIHPYNNSLVSPDGTTLYVGSDRGILRISTRDPHLQPTDLLLPGLPVSSLGLNPNGNVLYALVDGVERRLLALDPARGTLLGDLTGVVQQPRGIEQVTSS